MNKIICLIALLMMVSCDEKEVLSSPAELKKKLAFPFNITKARTGVDVPHMRKEVRKLIKKRQKSMSDDLFDLTYYYITPYGFANDNKRMGPKNFAGMWIKFDKNFNYTYGRFEETMGSGIFHYAETDEYLFMLDNDGQVEPKLFKLLSNSEFFNFVGQPVMLIDDGTGEKMLLNNFANDQFLETITILHEIHNGSQIMMQMGEEQPTKPVQ